MSGVNFKCAVRRNFSFGRSRLNLKRVGLVGLLCSACAEFYLLRASFSCAALLLNLSVSYKAKLCVVSYRIMRRVASAASYRGLKDALKSGGDEASKMQANMMLGKYFVIKGEFA